MTILTGTLGEGICARRSQSNDQPPWPRLGTVVKVAAKASALGVLLGSTVVDPSGAEPVSPPPDLVSWWPGDGHVFDIIDDNHGVLRGGASFRPGLVALAFSLDGVDDFILIPDSSSLNLGMSDFTIDLWVNFRGTQGEQVIIEKWVQRFEEPSEGWTLTKLDDNTVRLAAVTEGNEVNLDVTPFITENTWHFVALSRSGDLFTIYWDGSAIGSASFAADLDSGASLKFGHRCNPQDTPGCEDESGFYLNGLIDEVELFRRALDDEEIQAIFEAGSDGKIKPRRPRGPRL